ncbi:MAG: YbjN domain-containing protein [Verrucomicrobiales bacterium]
MRPPSRQIQSVIDAFGQQGWHCEPVEGRDVVTTAFEAHHSHLHLHAQAFVNLNALAVVAETPVQVDRKRMPLFLELLMRASKQLTLGGFEYDFDRTQLVFRLTNLFEKEVYDPDIISSLVHCAIAELDRMVPLVGVLNRTADDLLADLSIPLLLEREDLLPPVPEFDGEEEEL